MADCGASEHLLQDSHCLENIRKPQSAITSISANSNSNLIMDKCGDLDVKPFMKKGGQKEMSESEFKRVQYFQQGANTLLSNIMWFIFLCIVYFGY